VLSFVSKGYEGTFLFNPTPAGGPAEAALRVRHENCTRKFLYVTEPNGARSRILIISYLFPPAGGIGVQRALSLAKYLPRCGFEVHVLKANNAGGPVHDPALVRQIPPEVTVHQALTLEIPFSIRQKFWAKLMDGNAKAPDGGPKAARFSWKGLIAGAAKRVLSPEPEILWVPLAVRKARQIIQRHRIEFVLVTVPPFSALVVGNALKRSFPSLTLVSDFRDEWLSFYLKDFEFQNSDYTRRRAEAIEREAAVRSDLVIAVNRSSRDEIRRRYPEQPEEKFAVIPNGYDPEAFAGFVPRASRSLRMLVTHVGTVYKTASPRFYLDAVDGLSAEVRDQIETRFVGRVAESERAVLQDRKSRVTEVGFLPQAEALKYMEDTDYLLLTMTNDISVPGKLFEYMATGKPILVLTEPASEVDQILRETGCGISAPPGNPRAIQQMLMQAFEAWRDGRRLVAARRMPVQRYERPRLAAEYGELMELIRTGEKSRESRVS
jgi:glycosyltransferase involved in cell wall biosynthesis